MQLHAAIIRMFMPCLRLAVTFTCVCRAIFLPARNTAAHHQRKNFAVKHVIGYLLAAILICALSGCANVASTESSAAGEGVLTGTVGYRERVALPPDATVEVWMLDVSPGIQILPIIAEVTVPTQGRQVPIPFELRYDPGRVLPDRSYAVKTVIRAAGRTLFTLDEGQRVITQGHPHNVALWLKSVIAETAGGSESLWGTQWRLEDLAGEGVLDRVEATLEFVAPGKVAGRGSCNQFFGSATIKGSSLTFGPLGATRMACVEAINRQESKYLQALERAERYAQEGSALFVYSKGVEKPLRFVRK